MEYIMSSNANDAKDYYALLGVKPNASIEGIKEAMERKTEELEKEKNEKASTAKSDEEKADNEKSFQLKETALKEAFSVLSSPERRADYDAKEASKYKVENLASELLKGDKKNQTPGKPGKKAEEDDKDSDDYVKAMIDFVLNTVPKLKNAVTGAIAEKIIDPVKNEANKRIVEPLKEKASEKAQALKDAAFTKLTGAASSTKDVLKNFIEEKFGDKAKKPAGGSIAPTSTTPTPDSENDSKKQSTPK